MQHRKKKISILICCEGKTEIAFLKHIKNLYIDGRKKYVFLKSAGSGGLKSIENTIKRYEKNSAYEKCYGLLDGDLINKSEKPEKNILITNPCIEGFFLELLDCNKPPNSKECKKQFEKDFLKGREKLNHKSYERYFNKNALEKKRKTNPLLDKILKIFE